MKIARFYGRAPQALRLTVVLALLVSTVSLSAADGLRIIPLVRDGAVLISFEMADGFTDDVRAAIRSGLRTTFTYSVDLRTEVPAWIDRTIASAVVSTAVQYDNLTRRHTVVRTLDGRVEEAQVTESDAEVRQLVTTIERLPLFRTVSLEPNREYYVRVRAEVRPRNAAYLWPWGSVRSGQTKFTFIP
ncbi:MAG TPA: DUF4390 domain-containing protein [Vicinamibacterales bacterium]|nr:DUF4390 domain-containing protein [Vicinamibacterales bacterium]